MQNKKGFTLIELLVVVLIIGILSAVALPQYTRAVEKARVAEVETIMADLRRGYKLYTVANPPKKAAAGSALQYSINMPSLEEIMKAGGFSYPLTNGKIVTKNFTVNAPDNLRMAYGGCSGEFSATRQDGSYSVYFSSSEPVTKCCQGATDKGKETCKGLGSGWSTSSGGTVEVGRVDDIAPAIRP